MKRHLFVLALGLILSLTTAPASGQVDPNFNRTLDSIFTRPPPGQPGDIFGDYDLITSSTTDGAIPATQKCGEGTDAGVHMCVRYFNCDPKTKIIINSEDFDGTGLIDIRFGSNSCPYYLDVCCRIPDNGVIPPSVTSETPPVEPVEPIPPVTPGCGIRNADGIDFKIQGNVNGEAEYGEFPWMTALIHKHPDPNGALLICGGSLIAPNVILTGAHCVNSRNPDDILVRAGEWDTQTTRERYPYQERNVRQIISHENFQPNNLFNDVALLILEEAFVGAPHIATVCLPRQDEVYNDREICYATGWGKTQFGVENNYQVILKKIDVPIVNSETCQNWLRQTRLSSKFKLHNSFICAGGEEGKDACTGDGGGPLVCRDPQNPDRYVQTGIVAWGIGCGQYQVPGVYANVGQFRTWIDGVLAGYNIDISSYIN